MSNEGKSCDAVVKCIEQRTGESRTDIRCPETDRVGPPVELRLKIGTQEYAIEHTKIEAFEDQISRGVSLESLVGPVKKALSGKLPGPGFCTMIFPRDRKLVVKKTSLKKCQQSLEVWVRENALHLYRRVQERIGGESVVPHKYYRDSITGKPSGFSYAIKLSCRFTGPPSAQESGRLGAGRWAPGNKELEDLRAHRLGRALFQKIPKLWRCKSEGARTVLVLESDDIALTEPSLVGDALIGLQEEFAAELPFPDEIYFVDTALSEGPWWVWLMKYEGKRWSLEDWTKSTTFHVDELTDLTAVGS